MTTQLTTVKQKRTHKQSPNATADNNDDNEIIPSLPQPSILAFEKFLENPKEKLEKHFI